MQRSRLVFGCAACALAAAAAAAAARFPSDQVMAIGPAFFPACVAAGLFALGLAEAIAGIRTQGEPPPQPTAPATDWQRLALLGAALLAYGALLPFAGFLVCTAALVPLATWLFGGRHPLLLAANTLGIVGGTWLVFERMLGVALPPWGG